ncbi:MAG TPA: V-type ATP synthase subunit D [Haploplasma sp.]|nr:V-type ATP synthase subunit D [Haploplasma sp.]
MSVGQNNPTRMELMKLKSKLTMSLRGHKLLKDKQDELIHQFVTLVHKTRDLRVEVDNSMPKLVNNFDNIKTKMSLVDIYEMLMVPSESINVKYEQNSIMTVLVPKITLETKSVSSEVTYSDLTSPIEIDIIGEEMNGFLPKIILLAELEQRIRLMADEIERTRRRVNVIEHVMVPELQAEIKRITMKLEDNERSNTVRIMKSKEIVIEKIMAERAKRNK